MRPAAVGPRTVATRRRISGVLLSSEYLNNFCNGEDIMRKVDPKPPGQRRPGQRPRIFRSPTSQEPPHENTTRRRISLQNSEWYCAIVEGSDDAIISKTLEGVITSWNPGATRIFGYPAETMIGQSITRLIPADLIDEELHIVAELQCGRRISHFETIRLAQDGRRVPVSLTVSPIHDSAGRVIGASKVARDITERKLAEEHTKEAVAIARHAHLEADVANRAKTEFLAVMSHEIRTPLTSIAGFANLLMNSRNLTRQQRRYIELISTANGALRTIVDDILDFSKVEAGRLELDRRGFSPTTLLHDTLEIVNVVAAAKSLRLKYTIDRGVPDWLHGDDARLRQILLNLLNNAIKFTAAGSIAVNVTKEPATDGRERIRFAVRDTGIGIPDEQQPRLFAAFSQADSSISREYGGTGLGLAICKRLVELMDGEIGIVSVAGEGSTVWFTAHLPEAVYLEPKPEDSIELAEVMEAKARILVVDDLDTNREIVEAYLDERGYQVDTAGSAMDALQMLGSATYDLILMDIQMPVMDGVAATKRIRALPRPIRDVPIIAMTGNVLPEQVKSFLEAGMNDHVGKADRAS